MSIKIWIMLAIVVGGAFAFPYLSGQQPFPWKGLDAADTYLSTDKTRQTYYKWQDANGNWQFGDTPPEGVTLVPVSIDTAANVLAPVSAPEKKEEEKKSPADDTPKSRVLLNPADAAKAMEKAKEVQSLMESRQEQLDSLL